MFGIFDDHDGAGGAEDTRRGVRGRRRWRIAGLGAGAVAVALAAAACGGSSTTASKPSGTSSSSAAASGKLTNVTFALPILNLSVAAEEIAQREGFFTQHHLKVTLVNARGGTNVVAAVVSGSAQFGGTDADVVFLARDKNTPIEAIGLEATGIPFALVVNKQEATQKHLSPTTSVSTMVNDIKGMTIGNMAPGDTGTLILDGLVASAGHPAATWFTHNSVRVASEQLAALQHREIDATFTDVPTPQTAVSGGYGEILFQLSSIPAFKNVIYDLVVANPSWADAHPTVAREMDAALAEAQTFIVDHPAEAAKALASFLPSTPVSVIEAGLKAEGWTTGTAFPAGAWASAASLANQFHLEKFTVTKAIYSSAYTNKFAS